MPRHPTSSESYENSISETGVEFCADDPPPAPPGGGSNAYKADTRKPKGLTRLIRVLLVVSVSEVFRCVSQSHRSQIDVIN